MKSPLGSVVLLFGPPAAGKSSLAREVMTRYRAFGEATPLLYLGTDQLRETISGKKYLPTVRPTIYRGMRSMTESAVKSGHHVLVDGNYLEWQHRRPLLNLLERLGARCLRVLVFCGLEVGMRRNSGRVASERVPDSYLRGVYARLESARQDADLCLDSDATDATGSEQTILEWLLGCPAPRPDEQPSAHQAVMTDWVERGDRRQLASGDAVWSAGGQAREVILLLEGELEVVREAAGQPPVVINRLAPGELAGELSSLDGGPHSATVRATRSSVVVSLASEQFRSILRHHPQLLDVVLHGMVNRIRSLSGAAGTACVDLLTGLGNRRMLEELWPTMTARAARDGSVLSLALFDVDRFKGINDTFGHEAGDIVLGQISRILQDTVPPPGVCLRYGGDEFVVLLPDLGGAGAAALLERFAQRVREAEFDVGEGVRLRATVSAGVASYPVAVANPEELFTRADEAAYRSKGGGRDLVTLWT